MQDLGKNRVVHLGIWQSEEWLASGSGQPQKGLVGQGVVFGATSCLLSHLRPRWRRALGGGGLELAQLLGNWEGRAMELPWLHWRLDTPRDYLEAGGKGCQSVGAKGGIWVGSSTPWRIADLGIYRREVTLKGPKSDIGLCWIGGSYEGQDLRSDLVEVCFGTGGVGGETSEEKVWLVGMDCPNRIRCSERYHQIRWRAEALLKF